MAPIAGQSSLSKLIGNKGAGASFAPALFRVGAWLGLKMLFVQDAMAKGTGDQVRTRSSVELCEEHADMAFDRRFASADQLRDFLTRHALSKAYQDLLLHLRYARTGVLPPHSTF